MIDITTVEPIEEKVKPERINTTFTRIDMPEATVEKLGIEAIETVIDGLAKIAVGVKIALEDGKITLADILPFVIKAGFAGFQAGRAIPDSIKEVADLDSEEVQQLIGIAVAKFIELKA